MAAGRPTKYKTEYAEQAEIFTLMGMDDIRLADAFGISITTLNTWKKLHPEFLLAITQGKDVADGKVAMSLYRQAHGFVGPDGKYYPPNTAAAIFWLKNRQKSVWRDKQDVEHSGTITYKDLTDEELEHKISQLSKS